jgi:hypothetical protein
MARQSGETGTAAGFGTQGRFLRQIDAQREPAVPGPAEASVVEALR